MAIFRRGTPNGGVERRWGRQKSRFSTHSWLSIDDCCSANNKCDRPLCSLPQTPSRISESMFITACSMDDPTTTNRKNIIYLYAAVNLSGTCARRSTYTIEVSSYWQTQSIACLISATAWLLAEILSVKLWRDLEVPWPTIYIRERIKMCSSHASCRYNIRCSTSQKP